MQENQSSMFPTRSDLSVFNHFDSITFFCDEGHLYVSGDPSVETLQDLATSMLNEQVLHLTVQVRTGCQRSNVCMCVSVSMAKLTHAIQFLG